jgi:cold shock CspA family protein
MARGTVKWFNSQKGYGFIQPQGGGGKDVFVHISAVEKAGLPGLDEGQIVEYEEVSNRGKSSAENLKVQRWFAGRFNCSQTMEPRPTTAGLFLPFDDPSTRWRALVDLRAKSGKPLGRYFPEVIALLSEVATPQFVVDGELVIELEGRLAFDALQMRLHPAESRIRKLAAAPPARLVLFDMLVAPGGAMLIDKPLRQRRKALDPFMKKAAMPKRLLLSPRTTDHSKAAHWLTAAGNAGTDGVIAKRLEDRYTPGERTMIKVKRFRTADSVVGGSAMRAGTDKSVLCCSDFTMPMANSTTSALPRR